MGIRPKGLGLRLKSRQFHPGVVALEGDKCPFDIGGGAGVRGGGLAAAGLAFRDLMGLLLFALARLSSGLSSETLSSASTSSPIGAGDATRLLAADLVVGPK